MKLKIILTLLISTSCFAAEPISEFQSKDELVSVQASLKSELRSNKELRKLLRQSIRHASAREQLQEQLQSFIQKHGLSMRITFAPITNRAYGLATSFTNGEHLNNDFIGIGPNLGYSRGIDFMICGSIQNDHQPAVNSVYGVSAYAVIGVGMWTGVFFGDTPNGASACIRLGAGYGLQAGLSFESNS